MKNNILIRYVKDIDDEICSLYKKLKKLMPADDISILDIHVVLPRNTENMKFPTPIIYRNSQGNTPTDMLSYTKDWVQAFITNKWSGHIFIDIFSYMFNPDSQ